MTVKELKERDDVPIISADSRGVVTFINKKFENAYGWSPKDLIGHPLTLIIPKNFRDAHTLGFSRFMMTGQSTIINKALPLNILTKGGKVLECLHTIVAEKNDGEWCFGASIEQEKS